MNPYIRTAIAALLDARDDLHQQANRQFFKSKAVGYGDLLQQETTVRNALQLLQTLNHQNSFPSEANLDAKLAS